MVTLNIYSIVYTHIFQLDDQKKAVNSEQADDPITFSQLTAKQDGGVAEVQKHSSVDNSSMS